MGELTARALAEQRWPDDVRRHAAAGAGDSLAQCYGGESVSFDELPSALQRADVLVAATASPHPLIEAREMTEVMARPWRAADAARSTSPCRATSTRSAREIDGVSLYDIDDLQAVVARNRRVRQAEARKAEGIIEEEIQHFATWLGSLEVRPTLAALRAHGQAIAEQVVQRERGQVGVRVRARPRARQLARARRRQPPAAPSDGAAQGAARRPRARADGDGA